MKKRSLFVALLMVMIGLAGCNVKTGERLIPLLAEKVGIERALLNSAHYLVVVPQTSCGTCIELVKKEMKFSEDTLFVVSCQSPKDFFLLTGKRINDLPNAFIDKEGMIHQLGLAKNTPMVYQIEEGKYTSYMPLEGKQEMKSGLPFTQVDINIKEIDLASFPFDEEKHKTIVLTNTGNEALKIDDVIASCSCLKVSESSRLIPPKDTLHLDITFRADTKGEFIRDIFIYGNFSNSPLEVLVKGFVKE